MNDHRELAQQVLLSLRAGNPPWHFPFSRQPTFAPLFGGYGTGQPPAEPVDYSVAEEVIKATGARIIHHHRCHRPRCDRPPLDRILLPPRCRFINAAQYMASKFHEVLHHVEQPWRAGWVGSDHQGELVAECGTGFLEAHLGLPHDTDNTNIEKWLPKWAEQIEQRPDYLFDAVAQAERSVEYILGLYRRSVGKETAA
jgi:antirestriction protein ArdC